MTARRTDPTVGLAKARDAQADLPGIPQVVVPLVRGAK